jgi:hypothetical protein
MTVEIKLNSRKHKGLIAIVDDIDADLSELKWYPNVCQNTTYVYRHARYCENPTPIHRVILARMLQRELSKGEDVDHINNNGLDNRRENLRLASPRQNGFNKRISRHNTSGYKGVSWEKAKNKWQAYIKPNRKMISLGRFDSIVDAARAYNVAAREHFGEFAYQNVIPEDDECQQ